MKRAVFIFNFFLAVLLLLPFTAEATTTLSLEDDDIFWATDSTGDQQFGSALARGDINNDGFEDIVIGANLYDRGTAGSDANVGKVTIVYGQANQWNDSTLSSAVTITGENQDDFVGGAVAVADLDNDGYDDILIGATGYGTNGAVYLVYGQSSPLSSIAVTDSSVRRFTGQSGVGTVGNAFAVGDVNGDGRDDIIVGAQFHSPTAEFVGPGSLYIKYGLQTTRFGSGSFDSHDVKINGIENYDYTGTSIGSGGDIDNDGYDDILIGACECGGDSTHTGGKTFVVYGSGSLSSTINLSSAITLTGEATGDKAGSSVAILGDLNNDGFDDFGIGAVANDSAFTDGGAFYLVYGSGTRITSRALSHSSIIKFSGSRDYGSTGYFITGGNINHDAFADILVGTPQQYDPGGGRVQVIYGSSATESSTSINTAADLQIDSLVSGNSNYTGATIVVGDWNGDDYQDLSIGSPTQKVTLANVGSVHTYYQRIDADQDGYGADANNVLFDGTDCDDNNIAAYINHTFYQDTDGDTSGTTTTQTLCQGSSPSAPTGYRASVINTTDCNDSDAAVYANQTYYLDADGDTIGTGATENICSATPSTGYRVSVSGGSDCNDSDAAVSANQTYYVDADGDGLGSDTTIAECVATAPAGYVTNSNDTDDAIINNGVEISGDGIDNDGDGSKDEVNTVAANGAHPGYKNLSITSGDDYKNAIQSVSAQTNGKVRVTFKDGSIYDYKIFTSNTSKKTLYKIVKSTGRIFAVSDNGKQIRIVNLFTGDILSTKIGIKSRKKFTKHHLIMQDIRNDGNIELLVTSWDKKNTVYLTLTRLTKTNTLKTQARKEISQITPDIKKTKINGSTIEIRNSKRKILKRFIVTNLYEFKNPK